MYSKTYQNIQQTVNIMSLLTSLLHIPNLLLGISAVFLICTSTLLSTREHGSGRDTSGLWKRCTFHNILQPLCYLSNASFIYFHHPYLLSPPKLLALHFPAKDGCSLQVLAAAPHSSLASEDSKGPKYSPPLQL